MEEPRIPPTDWARGIRLENGVHMDYFKESELSQIWKEDRNKEIMSYLH